MEQISDRLNKLGYSKTFVMTNKARDLKAQGVDVISLTLGEPDFDVPANIKAAAIQAINDNYSHYSPVTGFPELKQAICDKLKRDNGLSYEPSQIVVSNGAKQNLFNTLAAIVNEGDEVIVPAPYWVSYFEMVKVLDGTNVVVETNIDSDFKITPAQLEAAITPKTRALLFSSPCNPSGSIYTYDELKALAQVLAKHPKIIIISDEIYEFINYEGTHTSIAQFPEVYEQTVVINGMSKAFAMTGWRIGYSASPKWLAAACDKYQGQVTSGANAVAQMASVTALKTDPKEYRFMIDSFHERRDLVYKLAQDIPGFKCNNPAGAFYLFPDVSFYLGKNLDGYQINDSDDFAMFLLEKAHVATVGGVSFGDNNCIRFSYAASVAELTEAMNRIKTTLNKLGY